MIDKEQEIYEAVIEAVRAKFPAIQYGSVPPASASVRPYISVEMIGNDTHMPSYDLSGNENAANHDFEVNVYSNKPYLAKIEAKEILCVAEPVFKARGYIRTSCFPTNPTSTEARIVCRYKGIETKRK